MELEVISPLHIGNGNKFTLIDFTIEDKRFIKINFDKISDYCYEKNIKLAEEIEKKKENFKMEEFFKNNGLSSNDFSDYSIPINIDFDRMRTTKPQINEFIKNANKSPYIPGSSIKGAIRTALFWKVLNDNQVSTYCALLNQRYVKPKEACKRLEKEVFGSEAHNDILRALRISDSNPLELSNLEVNEIKIMGGSSPIPTYIESLINGSKTNFELKVDEKLLNEGLFSNNVIKKHLNVKKICEVCNEFYKEIINEQLNYGFNAKTKQELEKLKKEIEDCKEDEMILNMGWGGGWYPKTIGLRLEKYKNFTSDPANFYEFKKTLRFKFNLGKNPKRYSSNFPKTKRITFNDLPLGWVKIKKLENESNR